jgi:hypothetical protein
VLAQGNRIGERSNVIISGNYIVFQSNTARTLVRARAQPLRRPACPGRSLRRSHDGAAVLEAGRQKTNISLAVATAVLVVAFFFAAFSFVLRDSAYA